MAIVARSRVAWKPEQVQQPSGCSFWESRDGMFKLVRQDQYEGIPLKPLWVLWQWKRGGWWKIAEKRSRKSAEAIAVERNERMEADDED